MAIPASVRASSTTDAEEMPHWVTEAVLFSMVTATGRWPGHSSGWPVRGSADAKASGSLSLGRKAQPASSAAAKMRQSAVRMRFIIVSLMERYW